MTVKGGVKVKEIKVTLQQKNGVRPQHIIMTGLIIVVLGTTIPLFFINPLSAMGFSIIIGLALLLVGYILYSINTVRKRGFKTIKWLIAPVIVAIICGGGLYFYHAYQQSIKDKIYSVNDKINMPGFEIKVTTAKSDKIPLDTKGINLNSRKDCTQVPADKKHDCDWYNWPRRNAQNYINEYYRATINYQIIAQEPIQGQDIKIEIVPDSGRKIETDINNSEADTFSFLWPLGYEIGNSELQYTPSPRSDLGGLINKGITRKGMISADLKKSEEVFDIVIKYRDETRVVRVNKQHIQS